MNRLLVFVAALVLSCGAAASAAPTEISVSGTGKVTMMPDEATVQASTVTTSDKASEAVSANNATYDRVVAALDKAGVPSRAIELGSYNVDYNPKPKGPLPENPPPYVHYGYTVTRSFSVTVHDVANVGKVVDAISGASDTSIGGVTFGLSDDSTARSRAVQQAVNDARAKAEALARAAGLRITGIRSISMGGAVPIQPMMRLSAQAAAEPTILQPSAVTVSETVSIQYQATP
jgi:uncharacterized protein YggE